MEVPRDRVLVDRLVELDENRRVHANARRARSRDHFGDHRTRRVDVRVEIDPRDLLSVRHLHRKLRRGVVRVRFRSVVVLGDENRHRGRRDEIVDVRGLQVTDLRRTVQRIDRHVVRSRRHPEEIVRTVGERVIARRRVPRRFVDEENDGAGHPCPGLPVGHRPAETRRVLARGAIRVRLEERKLVVRLERGRVGSRRKNVGERRRPDRAVRNPVVVGGLVRCHALNVRSGRALRRRSVGLVRVEDHVRVDDLTRTVEYAVVCRIDGERRGERHREHRRTELVLIVLEGDHVDLVDPVRVFLGDGPAVHRHHVGAGNGRPRAVPVLQPGEVAPVGDSRRALLLDEVEKRVIVVPVLDVPGARRVVDAPVAVSIEERRVLARA